MRRIISFIIYFGLIPILISCSGSAHDNSQGQPAVPVTVFRIAAENVTYYESYPGTVTALKEVEIRGEVTGYITGIFFKEGSSVHKGEKLYEIDRRQYESAFQVADENLKIAQENLVRIQQDADRYKVLNDQDAISKQQYDHAMSDLVNARSQVAVATAEKVKAVTNLEYSLITAPFDGTIGISQVKIGDLITPGQTLLNTISSDDPMGVDFVIDQSQLSQFEQLIKVMPDPSDSTFRLVLPDNSFYPFPGKIDLIDRAVDPQTGTIKVRVIFRNPDHNLRPGMNCSIRVSHTPAGKQILIPYKAVLEQMGEYFVFTISNDRVRQVKVVLGQKIGQGVIIRQGLNDGELIAEDGIEKLRDGSSIVIGSSQGKGSNSTSYKQK